MPTYYVRKPSEATPKAGENWLVYFESPTIEGCNNVLFVADDGRIVLLKTANTIDRDRLDQIDFENWSSEDYKKWEAIFGEGAASNELRDAYRHFRKVNDQL